MICPPGDTRWLQVVENFQTSAYRLETQAMYESDRQAGLFDNDFDPQNPGPPPGPNAWSKMITAKTASGADVQRIRVFDPIHISPVVARYQQWIRWYSTKNVDAGERHRYISRTLYSDTLDGAGLSEASDLDFWILDGLRLVSFSFDRYGNQTVEVTDDLSRIVQATAVWFHLTESMERNHVA